MAHYPECMTCANTKQGHCINIRHYDHGNFTCESMGVVYMITCNKPSCTFLIHIRETGQMLRRCMNGHRHSVNISAIPKQSAPISSKPDIPWKTFNFLF